jgi:hypothetical protein
MNLQEYEYTWLLPEFQESIRLELDFHQVSGPKPIRYR